VYFFANLVQANIAKSHKTIDVLNVKKITIQSVFIVKKITNVDNNSDIFSDGNYLTRAFSYFHVRFINIINIDRITNAFVKNFM